MGGIVIAFFEVDVNTVAPGIFLHDADKFGAEGVLCAVHVITQRLEDGVCTVIGNGEQPTDVRPLVDVGQHIADGNTALSDFSRFIHLEGE